MGYEFWVLVYERMTHGAHLFIVRHYVFLALFQISYTLTLIFYELF